MDNPNAGTIINKMLNFDTMIGKDFEEGLANLKSLAEK